MLRSLPALLAFPLVAFAQLTPEEAVKRMTLPDGFKVTCVAHEPMIRQPLSMSFDERGRLWVLQYIQYPIPAGLKPVKQDQYLRTIWDKVPEPPPHGSKGADKITILSDPDGNGVYTKSKDFLTGLNLASGFCLGNGGVYVLQSPYLLFYRDKNGDDVPDGDPEVLLTGFGFDDTHSVANSLQWGPDGWLYGAAGSTSTSKIEDPSKKIRGIVEFQQGIWRYQPHTKRFELFSEGGGNTFGLDFDKHGQCIAGTNFGGVAMLHHMQGAYYVKGFSKHGPLHNPHAYGYFEHVPYKNFQGGHVTCGGILYEADQFPEQFRGQYVAANLLSNQIHWHKMAPKGASFTAEHGGILLDAHDTWFRPVDCLLGPDGCVYVADWYDKRAAHLDPIDNWDKTNGRIYRIEYTGKVEPGRVSARSFDLRKKSPMELVELLKHPNMWWRKEARRLLGEQRIVDSGIDRTLQKTIADEKGDLALEALWSIGVSGALNEKFGRLCFEHENPYVRAWAIRWLTDELQPFIEEPKQNHASSSYSETLRLLAKRCDTETSPIVFAQLACSVKRWREKGLQALTSVALNFLINHPEFENAPLQAMLVWWALEWHLSTGKLLPLATRPERDTPASRTLIERVLRRTLSRPDSHVDFDLYLRGKFATSALRGAELAFDSGTLSSPSETLRVIEKHKNDLTNSEDALRVLAKLGDSMSFNDVIARIADEQRAESERLKWVNALIRSKAPIYAGLVRDLFSKAKSDSFRIGLIPALEATADDPQLFLKAYPTASAPVKKRLLAALLSRPAWATALLHAYDAGTFPKADLTPDHARTAVALNDPALTKLVEKHFGKVAPATPGEKLARINSLATMLKREKPGDAAAGKTVFTKNCAACHQLHGEGAKVGPDLTTADRKNRGYMLAQIVDPSGHIRPEYLSFTINTVDGRTLQGMVGDQTPDGVTLATYLNGKVEKLPLKKGDIDTMVPSPVSLMPEKMLDGMGEGEIRDLFAYLETTPASRERERPEFNDDPKPPVAHAPGSPKPKKYKVALISGSLEYKSDESLPILQKLLEENYPVECVRIFRKADDDIPGLDKLKDCDLAIFFTRRLTIDGEQLKAVKDYCESGKPILGIRTASHGFQKWLEMDKEVFGGDYKNHYKAGPKCDVTIREKAKDNAILKGVKPFTSNASLYRNAKPADDVTILMDGAIPGNTEPVTWTRERKLGEKTQRVFYTSLGHIDDFAEKGFMNLLTNATGWCLKDEAITAK
jgi:putative membrane-bound dehydrogenase-like protein